MAYTKSGKTYHCPVEAALDVIGGKWKPLILWILRNGALRYSAIQRAIPEVNSKTLTRQLRELEEDGVISRTQFPEIPPRVEYSVTTFGRSLLPIIQSLCDWGAQYLGTECQAKNEEIAPVVPVQPPDEKVGADDAVW